MNSCKIIISILLFLMLAGFTLIESGCQNLFRPDPEKKLAEFIEGEDENMEDLRGRLTEIQYAVTRENATEPPFNNEYWDNKAEGIYVDIISGQPLFSSVDKYDSGTGWPSFSRPIDDASIIKKEDTAYGMVRTEVRSSSADSHLGHLFDDGLPPTGKRYCINSAALRFIPKDRLEEEGYGQYLPLFDRR